MQAGTLKKMQPERKMVRHEGEVFGDWMPKRKKPSRQEMNTQADPRKVYRIFSNSYCMAFGGFRLYNLCCDLWIYSNISQKFREKKKEKRHKHFLHSYPLV